MYLIWCEKMNTIRQATVAGQFYEGTAEVLNQQIESCFKDDRGPGKIPSIASPSKPLTGVIVPHAGFSCSGAIAAHSFAAIAETGFAEVFIILGPNHRGVGSGVAVYPNGSWETPLGKTPVDETIAKGLAGGIIDIDERTHQQQENSIEVQLPFLQYLGKQKSFSIVPIAMAMQDYDTSVEVGKQIADVIQNEKRTIRIIASTDFSHEGMAYGRMIPANESINDYVKEKDQPAIESILNHNPKKLIDIIEQQHISMCGYGPVIALLTAAEELDSPTVELLKYGTSYEVFPDPNACVGYGAFAIK